jgi:hypothetical protein
MSSVSPVSSTNPYLLLSNTNQPQQDLTALGNALNSGDLGGAQNAFASFQKDTQNLAIGGPSNSTANSSTTTTPSQDMQTLQNALSSGDLSAAKAAYAQLMQDLQQTKGHHHHHHHHKADASSSTSASSTGTDSDGDGDGSSSASTVNVTG